MSRGRISRHHRWSGSQLLDAKVAWILAAAAATLLPAGLAEQRLEAGFGTLDLFDRRAPEPAVVALFPPRMQSLDAIHLTMRVVLDGGVTGVPLAGCQGLPAPATPSALAGRTPYGPGHALPSPSGPSFTGVSATSSPAVYRSAA